MILAVGSQLILIWPFKGVAVCLLGVFNCTTSLGQSELAITIVVVVFTKSRLLQPIVRCLASSRLLIKLKLPVDVKLKTNLPL